MARPERADVVDERISRPAIYNGTRMAALMAAGEVHTLPQTAVPATADVVH